jgi:predicted dehydrogenase
MGEQARVAVITAPSGTMHVSGFLEILAALPEVAQLALVTNGADDIESHAQAHLGTRLVGVYPDADALFAAFQPELTVVSLEPRTAPATIAACLRNGSHVLAEKPACLQWEEFAELASMAEEQQRNIGLAFAARGFPFLQDAKRLVASGTLGKLYGVDTYFIADQTRVQQAEWQASWFSQKAYAGGGHLMWLGIHYVDLLHFLTGQRIVEVAGLTAVVGGAPIDTEDAAVAVLRFEDGMVGTLTSAYYLDRNKQSHLHLWGAQGWLRGRPNDWESLEWYSTHPAERSAPYRTIRYDSPTGDAMSTYYGLTRASVLGALGMAAHPVTTAESLHVLKVVHAIYRAAETGQTQRVE